MRENIRSVRKINEIFLCIFTYIWKLDIFSTYLNFDKKWFFGYFKSQISKFSYITSILQPVLAQGMQHGPSNKQKEKISFNWTHCITVHVFSLIFFLFCASFQDFLSLLSSPPPFLISTSPQILSWLSCRT